MCITSRSLKQLFFLPSKYVAQAYFERWTPGASRGRILQLHKGADHRLKIDVKRVCLSECLCVFVCVFPQIGVVLMCLCSFFSGTTIGKHEMFYKCC